MKKIESFQVDHTKLEKGIYVSRVDHIWEEGITTFDIRMKRPNLEPVIDNPSLHAIEHLWATFLRSHKEWDSKTIYFGPMWCRTWFYVIFKWVLKSTDIVSIITEMFEFVVNYIWKIPWESPVECWNYMDLNLSMAQFEANEFLKTLNNLWDENLNYPS